MIRAGDLKNYIQIEHYVQSGVNELNEPTGSWQTLYQNVPAKKLYLSGRKAELARQLVSNAVVEFTIRYHPDITTLLRFTDANGIYPVVWINQVEGRQFDMQIYCSLVVTSQGTPGGNPTTLTNISFDQLNQELQDFLTGLGFTDLVSLSGDIHLSITSHGNLEE